MNNIYLIIKAFHIISVISWMAGMLYLPRLFVYHTSVQKTSEAYQIFLTMEKRLLKFIMLPAIIASFVIGLYLIRFQTIPATWLHFKLLFLLILSGLHGYMAQIYKSFLRGENNKSAKYFKILNEIPTILMIIIVILAVLKPL